MKGIPAPAPRIEPFVLFALIFTVFAWGLSFIGTKAALAGFHPFALVFLRFALASLVFLVIFLRRGFPRFTRAEHGKLFLLSLFEPVLYFLFETFGIQLTSASKASLIIAAVPIAVMLLASLLLRERIRIRSAAGIVLSFAGIAVLILGDPQFRWGGSLTGDLLILGAVATAALYIVTARDLGQTRSAVEITGFQIFYGAVFYLPLFLATRDRTDWPAVPGQAVTALLFLALGATVGAFLAYNFALTRISASRASVFLNGIPVVTAAAGWMLLGERLTPLQLAGGVLVLAAVTLTSTGGGEPAGTVDAAVEERPEAEPTGQVSSGS